jgi:hypothetical protein
MMITRHKFLSPMKSDNSAENERKIENWRQALGTLQADVKQWVSERPDWSIQQSDTSIQEDSDGKTYWLPELEITGPNGIVVLQPVAALVTGAEGRVDLYAWPSLYRVMLLLQWNGSWVIRTDSGLDWPFPWGKDTFFDLAQRLPHAL